jgi:hypothetical protein
MFTHMKKVICLLLVLALSSCFYSWKEDNKVNETWEISENSETNNDNDFALDWNAPDEIPNFIINEELWEK